MINIKRIAIVILTLAIFDADTLYGMNQPETKYNAAVASDMEIDQLVKLKLKIHWELEEHSKWAYCRLYSPSFNVSAHWKRTKAKIKQALEKYDINDLLWEEALQGALRHNYDLEFALYLMDKGINVKSKRGKPHWERREAIIYAKSLALAKLIALKGGVCGDELTRLYYKREASNLPSLILLLYKYGAKIDYADYYGFNPLTELLKRNFKKEEYFRIAARYLIALGVPYNASFYHRTQTYKNLIEEGGKIQETIDEAIATNIQVQSQRSLGLPSLLHQCLAKNSSSEIDVILSYEDPGDHIIPAEILDEIDKVDMRADMELAELREKYTYNIQESGSNCCIQ